MKRSVVFAIALGSVAATLALGAPGGATTPDPADASNGAVMTPERSMLVEQAAALMASQQVDIPNLSVAPTDRADRNTSTLCNQPRLEDPTGDGVHDIASVRIRSDCWNSWRWEFRFASRQNFLSGYRLFALEVDTDMDLSNGCGGTDLLATFGFGTGDQASVATYEIPSCPSSTWRRLSRGVAFGGTREVLTASLSPQRRVPPGAFRWFAGIYPGGDTAGADYVPDRVWAVAAMPPGPLASTSLTRGDGRATIRWQPPTDDNGLRVNGYRVTYRRSDGVGRPTVIDLPRRARTFTIRDVELGETYAVTVAATNAFGPGKARWWEFLAVGTPGRPVDLAVTTLSDPTTARLSWTEGPTGGKEIVRYTATITPAGGAPTTVTFRRPNAVSRIVTDLELGVEHTFRLVADNGLFRSAPATITYTPPAPPPPP